MCNHTHREHELEQAAPAVLDAAVFAEDVNLRDALRSLDDGKLHTIVMDIDRVSEAGLLKIGRLIRERYSDKIAWSSSYIAGCIKEYVGAEFVLAGNKDKAISKYRGKFAKRVAAYIKDEYGVKLTDLDLNDIGNIAKDYKVQAGTVYFDVVSEFDWKDGQYGHDGSCWWGSYRRSRDILRHIKGLAIRFYADESDYNSPDYVNHKGIGRVWIAPVTVSHQHTEHASEKTWVLFNAYGPYQLREVADIIRTYLKLDVGIVPTSSLDYPSEMYINNNAGYVYSKWATSSVDASIRPKTPVYQIPQYYEPSVTRVSCVSCGDMLDKDDAYSGPGGEYYCESCYDELFDTCNHCNETYNKEDMRYVGDTTLYCQHCYKRLLDNGMIIECEHCGDAVDSNDSYDTEDGNYRYCSDSCRSQACEECNDCGNYYYRSDLVAGLCENCRDLKEEEQNEIEQDLANNPNPTFEQAVTVAYNAIYYATQPQGIAVDRFNSAFDLTNYADDSVRSLGYYEFNDYPTYYSYSR